MNDQIKTDTNPETWPEYNDSQRSIKLMNGETLIRRFGKYEPGICFVLSDETVSEYWRSEPLNLNLNFDAHDVSWMPGEFWISRKGSSCFRPKDNGPHILVRTNWGGCFEPSRGIEYLEVKEFAIYSRKAGSNGGGSGYNYYVFSRDFRKEVSLDDI